MIAGIIIGLLIALWAAYVIIRRIKRAKKGIYCDCCDGNCSCCKKEDFRDKNGSLDQNGSISQDSFNDQDDSRKPEE